MKPVQERYEIAGFGLHIVQEDHETTIWLNTEVQDYDGLCIGVGASRAEAVDSTAVALEQIIAQLRLPAPVTVHACGDPECIVPHPAPHKRPPIAGHPAPVE